jgi:predicted dehydrogenase
MSFRVAVVGAGRMGKLHARVLSEMGPGCLACVVDTHRPAAEALAKQRGCAALSDVAQAVDAVDAAIIAVPTVRHVEAARPFIAAGKHVLIEKPFTNDIAAGEELLDLARRAGTSVQVGHTERFNPAVVAMQKYAIRPKFIEAHRISPFTFRSADVGVVMDMMIHDLDLVLMMVRSQVEQIHAVGVNVIGQAEDICNARLIFANGCVANVTASRLAIKTERKMRIFSEEAYLSVDYGKKVGLVVKKSENLDLIQMARDMAVEDLAELAQSVDYTKLLKVEQLVVDDSTEPLRQQAEAFRRTVEQGAPPVVSAADGLAAVRLADQIVQHIKNYAWDGKDSARTGLGVIRKEG